MIKPIRGKVARVLNAREIAINVGATDGVAVGMHFDVMNPDYENIRDPDTKEVLGSIARPKVRVKIIHVQEKLCMATTYRKKRVNTGSPGSLLSPGPFARFLMSSGWITKHETLEKTGKLGDEPDELDEHDSYVKTGDPVVQVIEEVDTKRESLTENTEALDPAIED